MAKVEHQGILEYLTQRGGHPIGRFIIEQLWKTGWIRQTASKNPELMRMFSEGAMALTGLFDLGGNHPLVRFANRIAETLASENLELLQQFNENPGDVAIGKKVEEKVAATVAKANEVEVSVALEHVHRHECASLAQYRADTAAPARQGKDGKTFSSPSSARITSMSFEAAMEAGKPLCGLCYPPPAVPKKADAKPEAPKPAAGVGLTGHLMRLQGDDLVKYASAWEKLTLLAQQDPALFTKLQSVFEQRGYAEFLYVLSMPVTNSFGCPEWHIALDLMAGKPLTAESQGIVRDFVKKEGAETAKMFQYLLEHIERWTDRGSEEPRPKLTAPQRIAAAKARNAMLRADGQEKIAAIQRGNAGTKIVIVALVALFIGWAALHDDPANTQTGSASVEQKEVPNAR